MKQLALILCLFIAGCSFPATPKEARSTSFRAVYLFQKDAQLSSEDLHAHPEVIAVQTFDEFKKYANRKIALWIDKSATPFDSKEEEWINAAPQAYDPIVLIGTSDTLYAFRDLLRLDGFQGPAGNYPGYDAPGFSVIQWKATNEPDNREAVFLHGFDQKPTVPSILEITNALLEGKVISTPTLGP